MKLTPYHKSIIVHALLGDCIKDAESGYQMYSEKQYFNAIKRIMQSTCRTLTDVLDIICVTDRYYRDRAEKRFSKVFNGTTV
jgi:hypothetical protein